MYRGMYNMANNNDYCIDDVVKLGTKFIWVTGGVCSSIGKGVLVSSLGVLLKNAGYTVSLVKWDPYLNVDPGTMSPLEHGEVFVTQDGAETDLDLGHYERLLGMHLTCDSSVSSGQIYQEILDGERTGKFLGKTIQLVPHVVVATKQRLLQFALKHKTDFVLLEIGGTVGDMEGEVFLEALRQLRIELGPKRALHCHLSYVPTLTWTGELKTKPTQHSVILLKKAGLTPDCLFLRADTEISASSITKLSIMCGVNKDLVFQVPTAKPIYKLFLDLQEQGVGKKVQECLGIEKPKESDLSDWKKLINLIVQSQDEITIGLIAKYVGSNDPYISVVEAIKTAAYWKQKKINIVVMDAEELERSPYASDSAPWNALKSFDGIVVPGGFDKRGIEGKILAARYARENDVPYFGLCLGMQVMIIEAARSLLNLPKANSTEFDKATPDPVVALLEEQVGVTRKGATMRLGAYPCTLQHSTKAYNAYQQDVVLERHRHRFEVNNKYRQAFQDKGIVFSGIYKEKDLVEISESSNHSFMLGSQFHPEFTSAPLKPHPLFEAFVEAVIKRKK